MRVLIAGPIYSLSLGHHSCLAHMSKCYLSITEIGQMDFF